MGESIENARAGDYIKFHRIVKPEQGVKHTTDYETGRAIVVNAIDRSIDHVTGAGLVLKLQGDVKIIGGETYRTARVDAGPYLGVVRAVLNDAELTGVQMSMQLEMADARIKQAGMYHTDSKGGA